MSKIITGLFAEHADAAIAINAIENSGISPDAISLVAGEGFDKDAFAVQTQTKLPEGVAIGATSGAAIGAIVAGLTSVAAIATGGIGLLAAGPVVAALTGAGAGAIGGSVLGGLVGIGIPEHEIKHYEDAVKEGAVLVGVECDDGDQRDTVRSFLERCHAIKISHA